MSGTVVIGIGLLVAYGFLAYFKPAMALLTVLFVAVAYTAWSMVLAERPENGVLALALILVTLAVAAFARREEESDSWARRVAMSILLTIVAIVAAIVALLAFVMIGAGFLLPLFFFLGLAAFIAGLISYGIVGRRATAALVFSTLGTSMRQNLPLPMALDCAAAGRNDGGSKALRAIKKWLVQGYPLAESIQRGYPRCPSRFLAMLMAAEQVDQLPTAIVAIEADMRSQDDERHQFRPVHPFYPVLILGIAFLIALSLMKFVVPQFAATLADMGGQRIPAATAALMAIMREVQEPHFLTVLVVAPVLGLFLLLYTRNRGRRPDKPRWLSWIGDSIRWYLPVLHWFQKNRSLLQVTELLRLALHAGNTVNDAIRATLQLDVNLYFRLRLKCWLTRVERGDAVAASARRCGLGAPLAWAFDAQTGDTPAILEMLESFYRSNYSYRVNLLRFILWPCAIIALGCTVGFIVYALFTPGAVLITELAEQIYP